MEQELGIGDQQDQEAPEEDEVVEPEAFADHPSLGEGVEQHVPYALADVIEAVIGFAQRYQAETPETAVGKERYGARKNHDECHDMGRHGLSFFPHYRYDVLSKPCWRSAP
jgi:hypothetical protein